MKCQPNTCRPGVALFTMIELLVVISVIVVLISILLPALKAANEKGKEALCQGNLRQIGQGLNMYADENASFFPLYKNAAGTAGVNRYWQDLLASYVSASGKYDASRYPHYHNTVFACPSLPSSKYERNIGDYGISLLFWPWSIDSIDTRRIRNHSNVGLVAPARDHFEYTSAWIGPLDEDWTLARFLRNPHSGRLNILYCDMHVASRAAYVGESLKPIFRNETR